MKDHARNIESLRERIQDSQKMSDEDRELLIKFSNRMYLLKSKVGDARHEKLLRHCTIMAENIGGLADALEDRDAAEEIVRWIHRTYDNENTNHDYRTALRMFGERLTDDEGKPESIEWIPSGVSSNYDPVPDPSKILEWESDILPMIEECRNARDKALLAVAFDGGTRSGELLDLKVGDIGDYEYGFRIHVDGKKGQNNVALVVSPPYLSRWLSEHPGRDDPEAPLWCKLSKPEPLVYETYLKIFKRAAKRAGITKPATPTAFRKANATYLARQGANQALIEDRQGRERGSDATAHYVARFGGESDDEYARLMGVEIEEEQDEPLAPVKCPRCGRETPRHEPACVWCHQALSHSAVETLEEAERDVRDLVFRLAREDPSILDDFEGSRDISAILENNPDLHEQAKEFRDALSEN